MFHQGVLQVHSPVCEAASEASHAHELIPQEENKTLQMRAVRDA
jgi:hypothetical protein